MYKPAIIVHGGVRRLIGDEKESVEEGLKAAARLAYEGLTQGGAAMDAVVAAVSSMEDHHDFNAGYGSRLNLKGEVELDAIVIDGRNLDSGAVCGVKGCANPVQLARLVMEKTKHCLLTSDGAIEFMESQGIAAVPSSQLISATAQAEFEEQIKSLSRQESEAAPRFASQPPSGCDTVGAVAMDANGNLAVAASTGGGLSKLPGRVGDSSIIGAGAYADNTVGAVAATGLGELHMKMCLSRRVVEFLERGEKAQQAAEHAVEVLEQKVGGGAGVIVLTKGGEDGVCQVAHHNTRYQMVWASINDGQLKWGMDPGEEMCALLDS